MDSVQEAGVEFEREFQQWEKDLYRKVYDDLAQEKSAEAFMHSLTGLYEGPEKTGAPAHGPELEEEWDAVIRGSSKDRAKERSLIAEKVGGTPYTEEQMREGENLILHEANRRFQELMEKPVFVVDEQAPREETTPVPTLDPQT
jgi:hypothetical protein